MPKNTSFLDSMRRNVSKFLQSMSSPYNRPTRKHRNVGGKTLVAVNKTKRNGSGSSALLNRKVKRGGMHPAWASMKAKSGHSGLRANAPDYTPYNERFPALPGKKKASKPLKKGEIWSASNNYKPGRGSAALKGGTRRR